MKEKINSNQSKKNSLKNFCLNQKKIMFSFIFLKLFGKQISKFNNTLFNGFIFITDMNRKLINFLKTIFSFIKIHWRTFLLFISSLGLIVGMGIFIWKNKLLTREKINQKPQETTTEILVPVNTEKVSVNLLNKDLFILKVINLLSTFTSPNNYLERRDDLTNVINLLAIQNEDLFEPVVVASLDLSPMSEKIEENEWTQFIQEIQNELGNFDLTRVEEQKLASSFLGEKIRNQAKTLMDATNISPGLKSSFGIARDASHVQTIAYLAAGLAAMLVGTL